MDIRCVVCVSDVNISGSRDGALILERAGCMVRREVGAQSATVSHGAGKRAPPSKHLPPLPYCAPMPSVAACITCQSSAEFLQPEVVNEEWCVVKHVERRCTARDPMESMGPKMECSNPCIFSAYQDDSELQSDIILLIHGE